jgi:hypothetical protein
MPRRNRILAAAGLLVALAAGCGPAQEQLEADARAEEWAAIQADAAALAGLRDELATVAASPDPAAVERRRSEIEESSDRLLRRVVAFLNQYAVRDGGDPAEVSQAIRLKSAEELILAREYIERGGDYATAIDILERARAVDPDNRELDSALAEAERLRFMDRDRFARVETGMTEAEVRRELGQVKHRNVRRYEANGVVAWYYPREGGAAAAVFFRERGGRLEVYDADFEALKPAAERGAQGVDGEEPADD